MTEGLAVNLRLAGRIVYVFGGGAVAARKIPQFLRAEAKVHVVTPSVCDSVKRLVKKQVVQWHPVKAEQFVSHPHPSWQEAFFVVYATDDVSVHERIRPFASHIPLQLDAVRSEEGNLTLPATWAMDGLHLTFSTAGISPGLAKMIREQWDEWFLAMYGERFGLYAGMIERVRKQTKLVIEDSQLRQQVNRLLTESDYIMQLHRTLLPWEEADVRIIEYTERVIASNALTGPEISEAEQACTDASGGEEIVQDAADQSRNEGELACSNPNGTNR